MVYFLQRFQGGTRRDWGEQQKRPWIRPPRVAAGEDEFVIFVEAFKDVC
ncbi:MAG TPA: hypothetical protein VGY48_05330 [Vicinamibacterales bacterium]|nr:hypothetical protein [Vicinamibacterales bacterium]